MFFSHNVSFYEWISREIRNLILNRMKIWNLGSITTTQTSLPCYPHPHPHHPRKFWYHKTIHCSALIKYLKYYCNNCGKYEIIQNNLPKLGTWILDFWNPHIMRFELIGSRNLHNKIKGNVSTQRTVLPVTFNYCSWTGDGLVIHHWINLPSHPAKTYMYWSRAFNSWAFQMLQSTWF